MGTTLTNTQPKDTYKSLLKTSDSSELSGTAKYVSDGNGNDSALAVSTSAVGIGTVEAPAKLNAVSSVAKTDTTFTRIASFRSSEALAAEPLELYFGQLGNATSSSQAISLQMGHYGVDFTANLIMQKDGGNIGIGIGLPAVKLDVVGQVRASTGILFGSDTAAANALDDYEEGTFTPTGSSGITVNAVTRATYTKVGNLVSFQTWLKVDITATNFVLDGLPITIFDRTTASISNITGVEVITNQLVGSTSIYAYGATTGTNLDLFIGGNYRAV